MRVIKIEIKNKIINNRDGRSKLLIVKIEDKTINGGDRKSKSSKVKIEDKNINELINKSIRYISYNIMTEPVSSN